MKSKTSIRIVMFTIFAGLVTPVWSVAQGPSSSNEQRPEHIRYKVITLGPEGGPTSGTGGEITALGALNNNGTILIVGDTPVLDPFCPNCINSNYFEAYKWHSGSITDLNALPVLPGSAGNQVYPNWVNDWGLTVGFSENGIIDPLTGRPENDAILWSPDGHIFNLGTLGGYQSEANAVNNFGEVAGWVENTTPDPYSFGEGAETQAFIWRFGVMHLLGTLGGPDSNAFFINDRGQAAGCSLTNSTPNQNTGFPTFDAFIWQNGKMIDLNPGNFGGTKGCANFLNNRGQVVGFMDLAGDLDSHPFLWEDGKVTDLFNIGNLGGNTGSAYVANERGSVAGFASLPGDQVIHAALWHDGRVTDMQTVDGDPCSLSYGINSRDQVVGTSGACDLSAPHAFLWEHGEMVDLNTLIPSGSGVQLQFAYVVNERGEIAANGILTSSGENRAFLLIPERTEDKVGSATARAEDTLTAATAPTAANESRAPGSIRTWAFAHASRRPVFKSRPPSAN